LIVKTILVTGSAGRLGQAAVKEFQRQQYRVIGIDSKPTPGLATALVDSLQNPVLLREIMRGVDAVLHLAATPDDPVWPLPKEAGDNFLDELLPNNIVAIYHILEAARLTGVKKVILASTGQVVWDQTFDGPYPISVDAKPTPRWWYASTKVFLEVIGEAYAKQGFFSVIAIRLGFCPRDKTHIEMISSSERDQDVYLSPGDAGRFFDCCVKADRPVGSFDVVYAASKPLHQLRFDMEPAKRILGFEAQESWPTGAERE
jgi:uronate dehydrogenase